MKVILTVEDVIRQAASSDAYRDIHPDVIRRIAESEARKGYKARELVKSIRSCLHQVGGAYQPDAINPQRFAEELMILPRELASPELMSFCRKKMGSHTSTKERLPFIERFFYETLGDLQPVKSVLDVACGLTPLAISWMPLAANAHYMALDMYTNLAKTLSIFFEHTGIHGEAVCGDVITHPLDYPVDVALILKTLPCLEQQQKGAGLAVLERIQAKHILVSYPLRSLGGNRKGMGATYEADFNMMAENRDWKFKRFEFPNELAFRIDRV
jgi:16S rRNA (guanine(1405)-N(7))-methyltransferase